MRSPRHLLLCYIHPHAFVLKDEKTRSRYVTLYIYKAKPKTAAIPAAKTGRP